MENNNLRKKLHSMRSENNELRDKLKDYQEQLTNYANKVRTLEDQIRTLKHSDRQTKRQVRIDYAWDGEDANLSDKVSNWVKVYLFPRYKFLKDGWME